MTVHPSPDRASTDEETARPTGPVGAVARLAPTRIHLCLALVVALFTALLVSAQAGAAAPSPADHAADHAAGRAPAAAAAQGKKDPRDPHTSYRVAPGGKAACRRFDPNLVNGVCMEYASRSGTSYTWLGTYRAPDGRVFFCIDYLYDSRLPGKARLVSTKRLVNQLGRRVGAKEVAALNYVISTYAGRGSTGSDTSDAAIALIVRQVMSDGRRGDGTVVYPQGLKVGARVKSSAGSPPAGVLGRANTMWAAASRYFGPLKLTISPSKPVKARVGKPQTYRIALRSASGRLVPGKRVAISCTGPVRCPSRVATKSRAVTVRVTPRAVGRYTLRASTSAPGASGMLYQARGWSTHGGSTASSRGIQRAWIAKSNTTAVKVSASAKIDKAKPTITTVTSAPTVTVGAAIHDNVTITGLRPGYDQEVRASLWGPFSSQPGTTSCVPGTLAGRVEFRVRANGTYQTPKITLTKPGYYTWTENLPGDAATEPVSTPCGLVPETTIATKHQPVVSTVASLQQAQAGGSIYDTVRVSGTGGNPVTVGWVLHGPISPKAGPTTNASCDGLSWSSAPVRARGTFAAAGDGSYRTAVTKVNETGCYTYSETIAATPLTEATSTQPGVPVETVVVTATPKIITAINNQRASTGAKIMDRVEISGLTARDRITVAWTLHGPLAPTAGGSCRSLNWDGAPVRARGSFTAAANRTYATSPVTITSPGCYTYSEAARATTTTKATSTKPGVPVETTYLTRPPVPRVPEVPSGPYAAGGILAGVLNQLEQLSDRDGHKTDGTGQAGPGRRVAGTDAMIEPTRRTTARYYTQRYVAPASAARAGGGQLRIPAAKISAPVDVVGLDDGGSTMAIPNDKNRTGWLNRSARPTDVTGAAVIGGHVSDNHDRPGSLWRLREVKRGDVVTWTQNGKSYRYRVTTIARYDRNHGVPASTFTTGGPHLLRLISCTNRRNTSGGGFHYTQNLVVTATPIR